MNCATCSHDRDYHGWIERSDGVTTGICGSPPGECECELFEPDLIPFTADMEGE